MNDLTQRLTYQDVAHEPDAPPLKVAGVCVAYATLGRAFMAAGTAVNAIEHITFQAALGEQIAIIGPNGAGKSTLLKVVAGIIKPDDGSVEIFGNAPDKHICIAYVPQRSEIDWRFPVTVADVVMMGRTKKIGFFRRPSKQDHRLVWQSLERVQIADLAHKQIGELSGGQQQRVFIARALAMETDLLLMDEPLAGLDILSQEAMMEILAGLRPDGVTVLVTTHDLGMAAERFDKVMLLHRQVVALGPATAVLTPNNLLAAFGGSVQMPHNGHG